MIIAYTQANRGYSGYATRFATHVKEIGKGYYVLDDGHESYVSICAKFTILTLHDDEDGLDKVIAAVCKTFGREPWQAYTIWHKNEKQMLEDLDTLAEMVIE
jgi:hypothetical protein